MTRMVRTARPSPALAEAMDIIAKQPVTPIVYKEDDDEGGASKVDYVGVIKRYKDKVTNRSSAIRAKCVECSGGMLSEVRECRVVACALHPYRLGTDPFNKKTLDRLARENAEGEE
jgi:hypothetical protein